MQILDTPKEWFHHMADKIGRLEKYANFFSRWLNWVAGVGLVTMVGLTVADIIGMKFFKQPIPGAIEMVGFLGVVITAFAIAYTLVLRGHIQVEFFVTRMPGRVQAAASAFTSLLGIVLFALLAWRSYDFALVLQNTGEVSMTQSIPFYPFVYAIAFCCLPVCLVLLGDFLKSMARAVKK